MGRPKSSKKDKWEKLPVGFKDAIAQASTDEIEKRISAISVLEMTDRAMFKQDPEVAMARERLKYLSEPFRQNLASYRLQLEWCKRVLDDKDGGAKTAQMEQSARNNSEEEPK